jgi:hypothetical protein
MGMPAKAQTWPVPMYKAIASSAISFAELTSYR